MLDLETMYSSSLTPKDREKKISLLSETFQSKRKQIFRPKNKNNFLLLIGTENKSAKGIVKLIHNRLVGPSHKVRVVYENI